MLAEMQNVFVSLRPESRYIFFKASPVSGPAARGTEEGGLVGRKFGREGGGGGVRRWRVAGIGQREQREPPYETVISTDSAIFLHLLPPLPMTPPLSLPLPPFLCPYPLIWSPQPNECTSTAGLTLTVAGRSFQPARYRGRKTQGTL